MSTIAEGKTFKLISVSKILVPQTEIDADRSKKEADRKKYGYAGYSGGYAPDYTGRDAVIEFINWQGLPQQIFKSLMHNSKGYYIKARLEYGYGAKTSRQFFSDEEIAEAIRKGENK